jgi:hypothetical protein
MSATLKNKEGDLMGAILAAHCPCGYTSGEFLVGGGMTNFTTYCGAPGVCTSCGAFAVFNYLDATPRCSQCQGTVRFYDEPALQAPPDPRGSPSRAVFSWNMEGKSAPFLLADVLYQCPKCHELSMRFMQLGNWD